jgi:hypothetical protein
MKRIIVKDIDLTNIKNTDKITSIKILEENNKGNGYINRNGRLVYKDFATNHLVVVRYKNNLLNGFQKIYNISDNKISDIERISYYINNERIFGIENGVLKLIIKECNNDILKLLNKLKIIEPIK